MTTTPVDHDTTLLHDLLAGVLRDHATVDDVRAAEDEGGFSSRLWEVLAEAGLPWVSVPEEAGGSGGTLGDALGLQRLLGAAAAPVPVAETGLLAGWLLADAGLEVPGPSPTTAAVAAGRVDVHRVGAAVRLSGELLGVPAARHSGRLALLLDDGTVASLELSRARVQPRANLAGEARDTVLLDGVDVPAGDLGTAAGVDAEAFLLRARLARVLGMVGAMERVLELTTRYAVEREQFGRPIARFQAVQNHLVRVAEETACARVSSDVAAAALAAGQPQAADWTAMASVTVSGAARVVSAGAHQVHGAMGMTREYPLALFTRRLWSWRAEYGSERAWQRLVGRTVAARRAEEYWPLVASGLAAS